MAFLSKERDVVEWLDKHCELTGYTDPPKYFSESNTVKIDLRGRVTVEDDVRIYCKDLTQIPVQFVEVTSDCHIVGSKLTSLLGCPREVGGNFVSNCKSLETLAGGPKKVLYSYKIMSGDLKNLTGLVRQVGHDFWLPWHEALPVLGVFYVRSAQARCNFTGDLSQPGAAVKSALVTEIINRWLHLGPAGMMPASVELIKAGLSANARLD